MRRTFITLFAIVVVFGATAQEVKIPEQVEFVHVAPRPVPFVFDADAYYRSQVAQPAIAWNIHSLHCSNSNFDYDTYYKSLGPQPLNEDLPFVHTLTGAVFTFDYIRPMAR